MDIASVFLNEENFERGGTQWVILKGGEGERAARGVYCPLLGLSFPPSIGPLRTFFDVLHHLAVTVEGLVSARNRISRLVSGFPCFLPYFIFGKGRTGR